MKKVRVGVIGLGVGARHAAAYATHPAAEVAALCDRNEARLAEVGSQYPTARRAADAESVLRDPSIEAVSIASYDADHYPQIMAALEAGKHVLVEKPVCLSRAEATHIQRLLTGRPELVFSSHFPLRQTPLYRELTSDVQRGRYGQLYLIEAAYNYGRLPKLLHSWRSEAAYYSVVLSGGVHMVDLLLQLTGEQVTHVQAMSCKIASAGTEFRFPDCVVATLRFASGLVATLTCNFGNVSPHFTPVRVYGTAASFEQDMQGARRYTSRDPADAPEAITTPYRQEKQADSSPQLHSFVDAIVTGQPPQVRANEIFSALEVCFAIEEALREPVRV